MLLSLFAFAFRSAVNPEVLSSVPPLSVKGIWRPSEVAHIVRMVDAPIAVIAQRVSQGIGDFGRIGEAKCGCVCHATTLAGRTRTEQELRAASIAVMRNVGCTQVEAFCNRTDTGGEFAAAPTT